MQPGLVLNKYIVEKKETGYNVTIRGQTPGPDYEIKTFWEDVPEKRKIIIGIGQIHLTSPHEEDPIFDAPMFWDYTKRLHIKPLDTNNYDYLDVIDANTHTSYAHLDIRNLVKKTTYEPQKNHNLFK